MAVPLVVFGKWIGGMLFRPDDDVHTATVPDPKYWKESREIYGAMSSWRWGGKKWISQQGKSGMQRSRWVTR